MPSEGLSNGFISPHQFLPMPSTTQVLLDSPPRIGETRAAPFPWRGVLSGAIAVAASFWLFSVMGRWHEALPLPRGVDPLLQSLPRWDADWLLSWAWIAFHPLVILAWGRTEPARLPWWLRMIAFWFAVRAVFVALNPVGPPEGLSPIFEGGTLSFLRGRFIFDTELFFSGHTGAPFLYALLSRPGSRLRVFCLAFSALMAAGVLLTRNHFIIDVLGAYFMTYSIAALGRRALKRWEPA